MNIHRDPAIRQQVEEIKRNFQQWLPKPEVKTLELRIDDINPGVLSRNADYRPERDGVATVQKAIQYTNEPASVFKTDNSLLSQAASVNNPQDESMTPLYRALFNIYGNTFGPDKAVTGYGRSYPYHANESYGEAEKKIGRTVVNYVNKGLGAGSAVYGKNGDRTVSEPDQTTGKLVPFVFQNMAHGAVANALQDIGVAEGFRYDPKYGSREAFAFEKGMDKAILEGKTSFYSFASLTGELVYNMTGGDPKALRAVQGTLKQYRKQMNELKPMTLDQIHVEGNPEKTMQNVTDYFYQTLGDQIVKVPMSILLGKAESIAAITGMSVADVSAKIHAGMLENTGEGHAAESVMYGIPLGMLSLLNVPFQAPSSIHSGTALMDWVQSVVMDYGIGKMQDKGVDFVVDQYNNKYKKDLPPF